MTNTSLEQLQAWMDEREEGEHLEFKEAKNKCDFEELVQYCVALANERGGKMILGVTNALPRKVVGSHAFDNLERTRAGIFERLKLRVDAEEVPHPDGRVVVFHVPSRPLGVPLHYRGAYWMRSGDSLVPMSTDQLKRILDEAGPDFSAAVCHKATIADLDPSVIEEFRRRWVRKSGNHSLEGLTTEQLLTDAELLTDGAVTYAALILFGTNPALGRHLSQAEVVFEYRSSEAPGPALQRVDHRQGFFSFADDIWHTINLRNEVQHYRDGLFVWDIPTFNETAVRETLLNAVSHRDYRNQGSVFVRQFPRKLVIVSPGGFPPGISVDNILDRQSPRNRRVAEALARCGLVERSGQGMNLIYEECLRESKGEPDFSGTDDYQVSLTLHGEIQDAQFLRFLEKVGQETLRSFTAQHFLALDRIHRELPLPDSLRGLIPGLIELGAIERASRGRLILSRKFYGFLDKKGVYTRKKGLDRETNKALLMKHIEANREEGSPLRDLLQVLPHLSPKQVQRLIYELKEERRIFTPSRTRASRWFPVPVQDSINPKANDGE